MPCGPICPASDALCIAGLRATAHAADPWIWSIAGPPISTRLPRKTKMLPVTFGTHKKQCFCPAPSVRGWFRHHWRQSSFGGRFRNTRTAAGFEPMPSKTQPDKMLPVTFGSHKKQFFCPAPSVRGWFPNHWRKTLGGGDPTKCLAHAKQNPAPQNASPYLWNR